MKNPKAIALATNGPNDLVRETVIEQMIVGGDGFEAQSIV